jgi:hypothetical protein
MPSAAGKKRSPLSMTGDDRVPGGIDTEPTLVPEVSRRYSVPSVEGTAIRPVPWSTAGVAAMASPVENVHYSEPSDVL